MPVRLVSIGYPEETPLRESKELLSQASDKLRSVIAQFGTDWSQLAAAFPKEGFTGNSATLTACDPPKESAHGGATFKMATKGGSTSSYSVEERCVRCGDEAGKERVHIFQSGVTLETCAGFAIDFIDGNGDAEAVPADKLYEYRRQERAWQEREAAAAHAAAHRLEAIVAKVKQALAALPLPGFGRIMGRSTLHPQGADVPTVMAAPEGPRINPVLITRETLESMLRKHTDTLQAAAAILEKNLGTLQAKIAELRAKKTPEAGPPAEQEPPPATRRKEE